MLTVTDLRVSYQDAPAVDGVSLSLSEGELVSLVGSNGAGKSSVLAAIAGLHRPIGGTVVFDGKDVSRLPAHKIARLGLALVPEGRRLFAHQTVRANLILGAYVQRDAAVRESTLERVFELFPVLGQRLSQRAGMLSGGEQQMLALGRALMSRPRLLVLDEPSLGIAPRTANLIFEAISRVRAEGMTVLLVEQNLRAALRLSDRLYVLQTGSLVLSGTAEELAESPLIRQAYLGL
ncbi:ABC transporter ATP-binding protein [Actinophytocola sp.]|uniref:ABC transporter ATP-binding protein n=1 Tax=Actinophytocola sp. TaxID=1872138 RepID=UPI002D6F4615|nr:ABC transporter ATP-binding protein [Actinophytocola sp.]HYQ62411.1 ABC transporter ATP-binding protein [Actinophytocola sp.]